VIGQYFNQDEDESSADEAKPLVGASAKDLTPAPRPKAAPAKKLPRIPPPASQKPPAKVESSDEEEEDIEPVTAKRVSPLARARMRPPASFFSMDFLEDPGDEDELMEWRPEEQDAEVPASTRSKAVLLISIIVP